MANSMARAREGKAWLVCAGCLMGVLCLLFFRSFSTELVLFANDGPLGTMKAQAVSTPGSFTGVWLDLNWLGANAGSHPPSPSFLLMWVLGPLGFAKFYGPITLLLLWFSGW